MNSWKEDLMERVNSLSSRAFKNFVAEILRVVGIKGLESTKINLTAEDNTATGEGVFCAGPFSFDVLFRCMRNQSETSDQIRILGSKLQAKDLGLVILTRSSTKREKSASLGHSSKNIALIDDVLLCDLCRTHGIGLSVTSQSVVSVVPSQLNALKGKGTYARFFCNNYYCDNNTHAYELAWKKMVDYARLLNPSRDLLAELCDEKIYHPKKYRLISQNVSELTPTDRKHRTFISIAVGRKTWYIGHTLNNSSMRKYIRFAAEHLGVPFDDGSGIDLGFSDTQEKKKKRSYFGR